MYILSFLIFFRVIPPEDIYKSTSKKQVRDMNFCISWDDTSFSSNSYWSYFMECDGSRTTITLTVTRNKFSEESSNQYLIHAINVEFIINGNKFDNCSFKDSLIHTENDNNNFSMGFNNITNCFDKNLGVSTADIIKSNSYYALIQNNNIIFQDKNKSCRAIYLYKSKYTQINNNLIKKANVGDSQGSSIVILENYSRHSCTIQECTFLDCGTSDYVISSTIMEMTISNSTILFDEADDFIHGGISIHAHEDIIISMVQFLQTNKRSALFIDQSSGNLTIANSFFDSCSEADKTCFDISTRCTSIFFANNTMTNINGIGRMRYFGSINCNNQIN